MAEKKETHIQIRCTLEERELIRQLAEMDNRTISNYIMTLVLNDKRQKNK